MFGGWQTDRVFWCDAADLPEPALRLAAKRRLAQIKAAEDEDRATEILKLDRAFAALLDGADGMAPEALNAALEALARIEAEAA